MKKLIFLPFVLMLFASTALFGQSPVPDPDTLANPVQEGDPAVKQLPPRMDYVDDRKRITPDELPDPVKLTLESSAQHTGWRKAMIYQLKNKEEYMIEFKEAEKTTTYKFDKEGKPILED